MQLLHIDSSILGDHSVSRTLSREIVEAQLRKNPGLKVVYRDLAAHPLGHITGLHMALGQGKPVDVSPALQQDFNAGVAALDELLASDLLVIGAPMYNFTVPTQLKAWIDRIAVAGKTFKYGPNGAEGLLGGKRVIIASSRGGLYGLGSPSATLDHQETYLSSVFQFVGIKDVQFIRAEGVGKSDYRAKAIESAKATIATLA